MTKKTRPTVKIEKTYLEFGGKKVTKPVECGKQVDDPAKAMESQRRRAKEVK